MIRKIFKYMRHLSCVVISAVSPSEVRDRGGGVFQDRILGHYVTVRSKTTSNFRFHTSFVSNIHVYTLSMRIMCIHAMGVQGGIAWPALLDRRLRDNVTWSFS